MTKVVLIVEPDAATRTALGHAFSERGMAFAEAPDMAQGMAALGGSDFVALVVGEGSRVSLRGLCRLARKRHPAIYVMVRLNEGSVPQEVQQAVATLVSTCPNPTTPDAMATLVTDGLSVPAPLDFFPMNTGMVEADVRAALDAELAAGVSEIEGDDTDVFAGLGDDSSFASAPPGPPPLPEAPLANDTPLLEGTLEEESGGALLMGLFAQELTGMLQVKTGAARGTLWFQRGDPLWADEEAGAPPRALSDVIRERVVALTEQPGGAWTFTEKPAFPPSLPQAARNVFAIIMDALRRSVPPDQLFQTARDMETKFLLPGPALARAARRLLPFTRNLDIAVLIDGTRTAQDVLQATGMDLLSGTLVLLVLRQCHLVSLQERALNFQENQVPLAAREPAALPLELEPVAVRRSAFEVCVELMGVTDARQLLGLHPNQPISTMDDAYQQRLMDLDLVGVESGSASELLRWRVGALRERVQRAYEGLRGAG